MQDELIRHKMDSTSHVSGSEKIIWNAKAPNESHNLTGVPTAPTPSAIFTDIVYTHPTPINNLTNNSYIQVKVDRDVDA